MKKNILIVISLLLFIFLSIILFFNVINLNNEKKKIKNNIVDDKKLIEQNGNVNKQNIEIPLIKMCETKECILEKFKQCEQFQFNYNKEKSLYFAILEKTDKDICMVVLDLSMTKNLSCNLKLSDLTDKSFNEILGASMKNLSYLKSIGCEVQS